MDESPDDVEDLSAWQRLIDALPFLVLVIDDRHRILASNRAMLRVFGPEKLCPGAYCPKVVHGLEQPFPGCPLEEAAQTGEAVDREFEGPPASGRWWRTEVYPIGPAARGQHRLFLHFARDITARRRDQLQLHHDIEIQTIVTELMTMAGEDVALDEILEHALERLLSLSWIALEQRGAVFLAEESGALTMRASRGLGAHGPDAPDDGLFCVPIRSGPAMLGVLNLYLRPDPARGEHEVRLLETVAEALGSVIRHSLAEKARSRLSRIVEQALGQSEERYQALVETSPDAIFVHDGVTLRYANPAGLALAGAKSPEEMIGRKVLDFVHKDYLSIVEGRVATALEGRRTELRHLQILRLDGQVVDVETTSTRVTFEGAPSVLLVVRDIRERRRLEVERDATHAELQEALQARDQFLAMLSHELRTPLGPALMTTAFLETSPELGAPIRAELGLVRNAIELQARLIDDLLDLTRMQRGKLSVHLEPIDPSTPLRDALAICRPDAESKQLTLELDDRALPCTVAADATRLKQVFWNLLRNAIKFTPLGGRIVAATRTDPSCAQYVVSVVDTGQGIEPAALPRLFEAFEQGGDRVTRQHGGLGLGLTISKSLVELHNGRIEAHSDGPGCGARFTVTLPADLHAAVAPPMYPRYARREADPALRVLVVEDDPVSLMVTSGLLRKLGHVVETAATVGEALDKHASGTFDVVVSDLGLPDGTGNELLQTLRRRGEVRAIALTGFGMESDQHDSRRAGFLEHLIKPVRIDQLAAALSRAMDTH
ncbi:MAG: PAS domain S-box protein [Deltaproteobacteria bacterium]|nr:PAS domain S-box protein [Deltaproteobacteria bacterium]